MFKTRAVISHEDVLRELTKRKQWTFEIEGRFLECFEGGDIIWIGKCEGYNFTHLPKEIQEVLKENITEYVGIYYDN